MSPEEMLKRANHPVSGECIICGGSETFVNRHDECIINLVKEYELLVRDYTDLKLSQSDFPAANHQK